MEPLISVIIPIYKAEKYIEKCVRCILAQTYRNLEVILVDDGSPDSSGTICDKLASEDGRIRVIHKENGGAATARNAGLDSMTGEYIAFVDADDYMESNYIEKLYMLLTDNDAQVAICGFKTIDEEGNGVTIDSLHSEEECEIHDKSVSILTGNDIILEDLRGHWEHVAPWGKLFRAELYRNVRYPKWFAHEDEQAFIQVFDQVTTVAVSTEQLYYYVQHAGSLMNTAYSEKDRSTYLEMWRDRIAFYSDEQPRHRELLNCVMQAYVAWNVLYLSLHAGEMTKLEQRELKGEIRKYIGCLFHKPHLFGMGYSGKLIVKIVAVLINTNMLRKRYVS